MTVSANDSAVTDVILLRPLLLSPAISYVVLPILGLGQAMKGYWPTPGSGLEPDGWFRTGDLGKMDEDGYFHIVDRIKDMINVSSLKVYSIDVDEVLFKHPAVAGAVTIGVPVPNKPGSEKERSRA